MTPSIIEHAKSPKSQLEWLRVLILPMVVMTALAYPWAIFSSIMATDSGTPAAMRAGYMIFFGSTFYLLAVVFAATKWSDWSLISAILLSLVSIANIAGLVFLPFVASVIPWIAIGFLGLSLSDTAATIIGFILFALFFVVVPLLSIWRLVRHAFDMDVIDHTGPVELWDLKSINNK